MSPGSPSLERHASVLNVPYSIFTARMMCWVLFPPYLAAICSTNDFGAMAILDFFSLATFCSCSHFQSHLSLDKSKKPEPHHIRNQDHQLLHPEWFQPQWRLSCHPHPHPQPPFNASRECTLPVRPNYGLIDSYPSDPKNKKKKRKRDIDSDDERGASLHRGRTL